MVIIAILFAIASIVGVFYGMGTFNQHCQAKFNHVFFTKQSFAISAVSFLALFGGFSWHRAALKTHGPIDNAIVLLVLGAVGLIYIIWQNVSRTNLAYGIGGTCIQLPLFAAFSYFGILILSIVVGFYILGGVFNVMGAAAEAENRALRRRW